MEELVTMTWKGLHLILDLLVEDPMLQNLIREMAKYEHGWNVMIMLEKSIGASEAN